MHVVSTASAPAQYPDSAPDFQSVILRVKTEHVFSLLEQVDLHVTQSLLQLCNLLFSLTYFPLQFVLGKENGVLSVGTGQQLETTHHIG